MKLLREREIDEKRKLKKMKLPSLPKSGRFLLMIVNLLALKNRKSQLQNDRVRIESRCNLERRRVEEKPIPAGPNIVSRIDEKEKRGKGARSRRGRGKRQQTPQKEMQVKPSLPSSPSASYQSVLTQGFSSSVNPTPSQSISVRSSTLQRQQSISFPLSVRSSYQSQSLGSRPYQSPSIYPIQNQYVQQRLPERLQSSNIPLAMLNGGLLKHLSWRIELLP